MTNYEVTQRIIPTSYRNECLVTSTEEHPISYTFKSSDESVISIDENGLATAIGSGEAVITVVLDQNKSVNQSVVVSVTEVGESKVIFTTTPIKVLDEHDSCLISAAYLRDGIETHDEVTFSFSGASERCYSASKVNANTYEVRCYNASRVPLTVTIEANGSTDEMSIKLYT